MSASSPPPARNPWAWPIVAVIGMALLFVGWGLHFHPDATAKVLGGLACLLIMLVVAVKL